MKALACDADHQDVRAKARRPHGQSPHGLQAAPPSRRLSRASVCTDRSSGIVMTKRSLRRRRLKRRLLFGGVILALLLIYLAVSVVRVGAAARDLMTRKARPAGLPR